MFENLNTSIQESSEEDLLVAAGEAKPTDKDKTDGKTDKKEKPDDKKSTKSKSDKTVTSSKKSVSELSDKNLDIALGEKDEDDDDKNDDDNKVDDDDDQNDDDTTNEGDDKDEDDKNEGDDDEKKDDEKNESTEEGIEVKDFLKARVDFLVKKGEWLDFEGREDVEWDEDTFAEVELKQREAQKEQMREELLDSFGPYGREIADYAANGGDPEDLIDIFKEQQRVENLSIDDEESQKAVVLKYATEFQNMKPERAKKYVDGLIADKELEDAAAEAKENMEEDLKAQAKALKDEQDETKRLATEKTKQNLEKFAKDVNTVLNLREDIPADEKRDLLKVLTKFDKKLQNGTPVNDFYFKFAEFRKDLPNYIELVRLVLNPKKYLKSVKNTGKTEASEKDFNLLRTANKSKKLKSSQAKKNDDGEKKSTFKLLY